ncbi:MAG: hypothetical protein ABF820_00630, partial [Sporolactobacillus sp.]
LFFLLLIVLFLKLAGLNPVQVAESVIPGHHTQSLRPVKSTTSEIQQLNQLISSQKKEIQQLQSDTSKKSDQITQLKNQLNQAEKRANASTASKKNASDAARAQVYAQTYQNMDPDKAAAIFEKLPTKQAASYLNMLDDNTKAQIL